MPWIAFSVWAFFKRHLLDDNYPMIYDLKLKNSKNSKMKLSTTILATFSATHGFNTGIHQIREIRVSWLSGLTSAWRLDRLLQTWLHLQAPCKINLLFLLRPWSSWDHQFMFGRDPCTSHNVSTCERVDTFFRQGFGTTLGVQPRAIPRKL